MENKKTIEEIFEELRQDALRCADYTLHPSLAYVDELDGKMYLGKIGDTDVGYDVTRWAKTQMCKKMNGFTPKYWEECPNHLRAANVNYWLQQNERQYRKKDETEINTDWTWRIRSGGKDSEGNDLTPSVRGVTSKKYSKFDDVDLVQMLMEILKDSKYAGYKIEHFHRDDYNGFHIRVTVGDKKAFAQTIDKKGHKVGDYHVGGIVIENSELGRKAIRIKPFVYRLVCTNGLIASTFDESRFFVQSHVGDYDKLREDIAAAMGDALGASAGMIAKLKTLKSAGVYTEKVIKDMEGNDVATYPEAEKTIERYSKECKYDKDFVTSVVKEFRTSKTTPRNAFGIVQAFTRAVQDWEGNNVSRNGYRDMENRVRVESDAYRLAERLAA
jgi:hypothetical protein